MSVELLKQVGNLIGYEVFDEPKAGKVLGYAISGDLDADTKELKVTLLFEVEEAP